MTTHFITLIALGLITLSSASDDPLLFLLGGDDLGSEILDLSGIDAGAGAPNCPVPSDLPREAERGVGAFLGGNVVLCGGVNALAYTDCLVYDAAADVWSSTANGTLTRGRVESAGAILPDGRWWITGGGLDGKGDAMLTDSTEVMDADLVSAPFNVNLPVATHHHYSAWDQKAASTYFLYASYPSDVMGRSWIYDFDASNDGWVEQPVSNSPRGGACGGYVTGADGREYIVITGGWNYEDYLNSTEVFSISTGEWLLAPDLPAQEENSVCAVYSNRVVVAGGYFGDGVVSDLVLVFDPEVSDVVDGREVVGEWSDPGIRLQSPRAIHVGVQAPEGYVDCL